MNDPLGGTPVRDIPGTVRGDKNAGAWVKVSRADAGERDGWVDTDRGERVSDYTMWLMKLPVVGVVPGSLADHSRQQVDTSAGERLERFLTHAREYLYCDPEETDDDVVEVALDVLSAVYEQAKRKGEPIMIVARGNDVLCVATQGGAPCTYPLGHEGLHSFGERDTAPHRAQCGDVGVGRDPEFPKQCVYDEGHLPPHSYEQTANGQDRCQAYGDRPCRYHLGHEYSHSYEGKCTERAADGTLCDLGGKHEAETPHDWMPAFGDIKARCRVIWNQQHEGYGRVWRCMFLDNHDGPCSFIGTMYGWTRCSVHNDAGARCWRKAEDHGQQHHYQEAK